MQYNERNLIHTLHPPNPRLTRESEASAYFVVIKLINNKKHIETLNIIMVTFFILIVFLIAVISNKKKRASAVASFK